ncbi:MAG: PilN domain-containing protein [Pseudomonadota bacterium]
MNARVLLDADMQTIGRWLVQAGRWWLQELRSFVPVRLQRSHKGNGPKVRYQAGKLVPVARPGASRIPAAPKAGARAIVVVPNGLCLSRVIMRPPLGNHDLQRMIALEADTLLPIPAGSAVLAGRAAGPAAVPGKILVEVAALPIDEARAIVAAIAAAGIVPLAIVSDQTAGDPTPLDFVSGMQEHGLLAPRRSATPFVWAAVALLLLLNIAVWIWRDTAQVARFEHIVAEQQPAVTIAQTIVRRTDQDRRIIGQSRSLRRSHDPLRIMIDVGAALPTGAWLQRYVWDSATIRLVGYRPAKMDVATALRRSARFVEVRATSDETQAALPIGEPFDISAKVAPR